ncbi:hypothetical protein ANTQUA_LOCUS5083 [Anthophora quadrimaculata]
MSDELIQNIQKMYSQILKEGKEVLFIWIPSHVGIKGNEVADLAAKTASRQDTPDEVERVPFKSYRREINRKVKENWNQRLARLVASKLPSWKPGSYKPDIDKLCRRDQEIINPRDSINNIIAFLKVTKIYTKM